MEDTAPVRKEEMNTVTRSEADTYALGVATGKKAQPGDVYALSGDLGAGKTVFAKGVAAGLGITSPVTSPTFTIMQMYEEGRLPFYHFDVYRIGDLSEMEETGLDEYLRGDGVTLIEWADLVEELLPEGCVHIRMRRAPEEGDDVRHITITT